MGSYGYTPLEIKTQSGWVASAPHVFNASFEGFAADPAGW